MKNSTGVVMQLEKRHAFIMTNSGEFLKVKVGKQSPSIGEVYSGEIAKKVPIYKYASVAASLLFVLFFSGVSYAYYTPVTSVEVNINPSIELKLNRWERIIESIPLNDDGVTVLNTLDIKNKSINEGLNLIVEEAKKDNFINESYVESGKVITVSVKENKLDKEINLSSFEEHVKKDNLTVEIKQLTEEVKEKPNKNPNKDEDTNIPSDNSSKGNDKIEQPNTGNGIDKKPGDKGNGNLEKKNNGDNKYNNSNNNGSSNGNNSNKEDKNKDKPQKPEDNNPSNSNNNNNSQGKKDAIETSNSQEDKKDHPNNKNKEKYKDNGNPKK